MISDIAESAEEIFDSISEWFDNVGDTIGEALESTFDTVSEWFEDMINAAYEAASDFVENIMDFVSELPEKISDELLNALNAVKNWASDLMERGRNAAKDLVDAIVTGVMSLPEKLKDIGRQLVEGLWEGIKSATGWLKDKVGDFADGVVDDFKDFFGIHSPSRVMRDSVGKYLAQGVGEGFTEELPDIGKDAVKTFTSIKFTPDIDPDAVRTLELQGTGMNNIAEASATSEIINNQYSYSTVNNNSSPGTSDASSGIIQIFIDKDMVGEIDMDKIDKEQGQKIQLRKRGLA